MKNTDCDHYAVLFRVLCRHIAPDSSRRRYNDEAAAGGVGTPQNNLHGLAWNFDSKTAILHKRIIIIYVADHAWILLQLPAQAYHESCLYVAWL